MIVMAVWAMVFPAMATGPLWTLSEAMGKQCQTWWRNMLYINNFFTSAQDVRVSGHTHTRMHTRMHTHTYTHAHTCTHTRAYTHTYTHTHVHTHTHRFSYLAHAYMHAHAHTHHRAYAHACMHACMHTCTFYPGFNAGHALVSLIQYLLHCLIKIA